MLWQEIKIINNCGQKISKHVFLKKNPKEDSFSAEFDSHFQLRQTFTLVLLSMDLVQGALSAMEDLNPSQVQSWG